MVDVVVVEVVRVEVHNSTTTCPNPSTNAQPTASGVAETVALRCHSVSSIEAALRSITVLSTKTQ